MHAVFESGGKQYRVTQGEKVRLEKLEVNEGESIVFDKVLLVHGEDDAITIGTPYIEGKTIKATVLRQGRADKIHIIKFRRRKHYDKQQGHRQYFTEVQITDIG